MMKNLIVLTAILSGLTNISLADDHVKTENKKEPSIYVVRHIEVEVEKAKEFEDAVAEKTQKYNRSEGSDLWFTSTFEENNISFKSVDIVILILVIFDVTSLPSYQL